MKNTKLNSLGFGKTHQVTTTESTRWSHRQTEGRASYFDEVGHNIGTPAVRAEQEEVGVAGTVRRGTRTRKPNPKYQ